MRHRWSGKQNWEIVKRIHFEQVLWLREMKVFRYQRVLLQCRMTMKLSVKGSPPWQCINYWCKSVPRKKMCDGSTHSQLVPSSNEQNFLRFLANSLCFSSVRFLGYPFTVVTLPSTRSACEDVDRDGKLLPDEFQILAPRLRIHRVIASMAGRFAAHLPEK